MSVRARRSAVMIALAMMLTGAAVAAQPNVVERWGIYASSTPGPPDTYPLFLEPFPTKVSCEVEARIIVANSGHAVCRSHWKLEFGTREQEQLWAQFWPSAKWIAFCQAQFHSGGSNESSGPRSSAVARTSDARSDFAGSRDARTLAAARSGQSQSR